jgi:hypothetical protein
MCGFDFDDQCHDIDDLLQASDVVLIEAVRRVGLKRYWVATPIGKYQGQGEIIGHALGLELSVNIEVEVGVRDIEPLARRFLFLGRVGKRIIVKTGIFGLFPSCGDTFGGLTSTPDIGRGRDQRVQRAHPTKGAGNRNAGVNNPLAEFVAELAHIVDGQAAVLEHPIYDRRGLAHGLTHIPAG